jgi:hypothetical protein
LEKELFAANAKSEAKYKAKARGIHYNLKDPKNASLRENLLSGVLLPGDLAVMTYEEMANPTAKLERQASE